MIRDMILILACSSAAGLIPHAQGQTPPGREKDTVNVTSTEPRPLPKIDRSIKREPAYPFSPRYCLLVFGPEAKTRVWVAVLHEYAMYVDFNANGDLTDAGEAFDLRPGREAERRDGLGVITSADGKEKHRVLFLEEDKILIEIRKGFDQYGPLAFASKPHAAPVHWFDGPLGFWVTEKDIEKGLRRGDRPTEFRVSFGTRIFDKDGSPLSGVCVVSDRSYPGEKWQLPSIGFPKDAHPTVDIEFPGKEKAAKAIRRSYTFDKRC
jgi:hypothetical protein